MNALLGRIRHSLGHRPWTVDVVSGLVSGAYGLFMVLDPRIANGPVYDFLDRLDARAVGIGIAVLGVVQVVAALLNLPWPRRVIAFFALWHWTSFMIGVHDGDPHARSVVLYGGYALANLLILIRV